MSTYRSLPADVAYRWTLSNGLALPDYTLAVECPYMDCPKCGNGMSVTDSRRVAADPQTVRRRRLCEACGTTFQTDERPRVWLTREGGAEPLQGALLALLRDVSADGELRPSDRDLDEAVRLVVVALLADGVDRPTEDELRRRVHNVLAQQGLAELAERFDEPGRSSRSHPIRIAKRGQRKTEPYDRAKLFGAVQAAAKPFLEPSDVAAIVEEIESDLRASRRPIAANRLRTLVSERLRRRDERAFLRYALGGYAANETLEEFLRRITPVPQVLKRDGAVVLFESSKLTKSIRRSFVAQRRDEYASEIAEFVAAEERRVRDKMAIDGEPEPTASIGNRVMEWLFDLDEIAWANYWLAFASDHENLPGGSPTQQLAKAHTDMRQQRAVLAGRSGAEGPPIRRGAAPRRRGPGPRKRS
jgi:transcriptional regulator NrdR family protein